MTAEKGIVRIDLRDLSVDSVKESEFNPRVKLVKGSEEYEDIRNSLDEFDFAEPLVVNDFNMTVLGGNQRLQVAKDLGKKTIPAVMVHIESATREKKLCLALNKIKGRWDKDKLFDLLTDEDVSGYFTGFDEGEIDLSENLPDDALEDDLNGMLGIDQDGEASAGGEGEAPEDKPAAEKETEARITISNNYKFKVPSSKYYALIESFRDAGLFSRDDIINELKRRLMQRD